MNFKEQRADFNQRWNITSSDSYEEAFQKFKQRILNIFTQMIPNVFQGDIDTIIKPGSAFNFCQEYSIQEKHYNRNKITIIDRLYSENNEKEFYRLIEIILSLSIKNEYDPFGDKKTLVIKKIKEAIEISDVNVAIGQSENGIILYPKGEKKLDEELVNKTLSFLNRGSNQHFEEALKFYQNKNPVKSAESLRRSLEEFLRYKLENTVGLVENIKTLQRKLKENNSLSETRNIIFTVFNHLNKYFNEHSKHGDGNINEPENEFLIYQTGLLMRYINKLSKFKK